MVNRMIPHGKLFFHINDTAIMRINNHNKNYYTNKTIIMRCAMKADFFTITYYAVLLLLNLIHYLQIKQIMNIFLGVPFYLTLPNKSSCPDIYKKCSMLTRSVN